MRRHILPALAATSIAVALLLAATVDVGWSTDGLEAAVPVSTPRLPIGGGSQERLTTGPGRPAADAVGSWPGFRGPVRDGIAPDDGVALRSSWAASAP